MTKKVQKDKYQCKYNRKAGTMVFYKNGSEHYWLDLHECKTSAKLLDFIFQVASKRWATSELLGDVVKKLNGLIAPQETLCSFGEERGPIDVAKVIAGNRDFDRKIRKASEEQAL
jgi:hypothetical protein